MRRRLGVILAVVLAAAGCGGQSHRIVSGSGTSVAGTTSSTTVPSTSLTPAPASPAAPTSRARTAATTAAARPTTAVTTTSGGLMLTAADSGATVAVRVGASVTVTLDDDRTKWGPISAAPDGPLAARPAPAPPPHGAVGVWAAAHPGTVRLTATGTAWCPGPQPVACPMWAQAFVVTLVIN